MFAPFLTGREKISADATLLLFRKHLDDPANPYRRELLEFKFKNQLVTPEKMEVVLEMLKQMTEKDRARIEEILQNHPAGIAMAERFAAKATSEVKLETARAALKKGFSVDDVAEITGLSKETVQGTQGDGPFVLLLTEFRLTHDVNDVRLPQGEKNVKMKM